MSSIGRLAATLAVLGTCMPAVALASSGTVQVIVGGEADGLAMDINDIIG